MWLPDQVFKTVISSTPLISIDLVVRNEKNEVLWDKRLNAPAKGFWFVPDGRIQKDETLDNAFIRLMREELGIESGINRADAKFLGVFEHFYDDAVFCDDVSTHYVVLGYEVKKIVYLERKLPVLQHIEYDWFNEENISKNHEIHFFSRSYIEK